MTTELEQKFFRVFGIEPEEEQYCLWECKIPELEHVPCKKECQYQRHNVYYPCIDNEKLIQIFLILNQWYDWRYGVDIEAENVDDFKKEVLQKCIDAYNKGWVAYDGVEPKNTGLYEDIQQLFKD